MEDSLLTEDDPLRKVKSHGDSSEPVDFETYRGLFEEQVEQPSENAGEEKTKD